MENLRRDFVKKIGLGATAFIFGGIGMGFSPKSYSRIIGDNDRIHVAVEGVHSRGLARITAMSKTPNVSLDIL